VDEPDRDRVQEMQLLATLAPGRDQPRPLEHPQVLHDAEAGHRQALLERAQRLTVLLEQLVQQAAPGRVGKRLEHRVHRIHPHDYM
jgi:hypothetical protein